MTLTPAHLTDGERSVLRAVALAYRRAYRAGASQGECHDAALREYRRVCPDPPADQFAASREVNRMVAAASPFEHGASASLNPKNCGVCEVVHT
jgi:hypothetical protein